MDTKLAVLQKAADGTLVPHFKQTLNLKAHKLNAVQTREQSSGDLTASTFNKENPYSNGLQTFQGDSFILA